MTVFPFYDIRQRNFKHYLLGNTCRERLLKKVPVAFLMCSPENKTVGCFLLYMVFFLTTQSVIYWLTSNKSVLFFESSLLRLKEKRKSFMYFVKLRPNDQNHCIIFV